jgi:hypothetical protein
MRCSVNVEIKTNKIKRSPLKKWNGNEILSADAIFN